MKGKLIKLNIFFLILIFCVFLTGCSSNKYNIALSHLQSHLSDDQEIIVREAKGFALKKEYAFKFIYFEKINDETTSLLKTGYVVIFKNGIAICSRCEMNKGFTLEKYEYLEKYGKQFIDYRV